MVRANSLFPSSKNSNFQNEDKSKTFFGENEFSLHENEKSIAGCALSLSLTEMGQLEKRWGRDDDRAGAIGKRITLDPSAIAVRNPTLL